MAETHQMRRFVKMHGAGNDFVVLDARGAPLALPDERVRALADRRTGIGCDQLITLEASSRADIFMGIRNADGSDAGACGNATRCIGARLMAETGRARVLIETPAGILTAERAGDAVVVDMGPPKLGWDEIPLAEPQDTTAFAFAGGPVAQASAVNMGNPHIVFFLAGANGHDPAALGPGIERDPLFPEGVNVSFAHILDPASVRLTVWERGAGLTLACGTAACATVVAGARRGLLNRRAEVHLPGGTLSIDWRADDHVWMTGPVATVFEGEVVLP